MNRIRRIITSFILIVAMISLSVQTASANETWKSGKNYNYSFSFTDDNLTPYKNIGTTGELVVYGYFVKADKASYSNIKLTAQIRDYSTGKTLASTTVKNTDYPITNMFMVTANVKKGQKIQLYFDASSINNPPGPYRKAHISYDVYIQ